MQSALTRRMARLESENPAVDPVDLQSLAIETLAETGRSGATWLRYESGFELQYDRAYRAWTRYQDHRRRATKTETTSP